MPRPGFFENGNRMMDDSQLRSCCARFRYWARVNRYELLDNWKLGVGDWKLHPGRWISNIRGLRVIPKTDFICWSKSKISVGGLLLGALCSKCSHRSLPKNCIPDFLGSAPKVALNLWPDAIALYLCHLWPDAAALQLWHHDQPGFIP